MIDQAEESNLKGQVRRKKALARGRMWEAKLCNSGICRREADCAAKD
jgi:hypothetical protein